MMDPISKGPVDSVDLDASLVARIRPGAWHWCRKNKEDSLVHVSYANTRPKTERTFSKPLPLCERKGAHQLVELNAIINPTLCGPCYRRLGQIGALA